MSKITTDDFELLIQKGHKILKTLPTLEEVFTRYSSEEWGAQLHNRKILLGSGVLSDTVIIELCAIAEKLGVDNFANRVLTHPPSFSAAAKQQILPPTTTVQKTISMKIGEDYVLCTGLGDWVVDRGLKRSIAKHMALPASAARHVIINPPAIDPITYLGMWPGMVGPFFDITPPDNLKAVVVMRPSTILPEQQFAISVSLYESLLLPIRHFTAIVSTYISTKQPTLQAFIYSQGTSEASS